MEKSTTEMRQSPRVVRLIPLTLSDGDRSLAAQSQVINAHGALILAPQPFDLGSEVTVKNLRTGQSIAGTVVWIGDDEPPGPFKLGVEFQSPSPGFWGSDYRRV